MYCSQALSGVNHPPNCSTQRFLKDAIACIHYARRLLYASHEVIPQEGNEPLFISQYRRTALCCW